VTILANIGFAPFDTDWIAVTLTITTPILLAAIGELISERAGVLNVGLEGMMLSGAFFSYFVVWKTHSLAAGVVGGVGGGLVFGLVMGVLAIEAGADQIVSGVGINLAALGLTSYLYDQIFGNIAQVVVPTVGNLGIPGLDQIPQFGPALFDHAWILYLAFLLVPASWFLLGRTRWGLSVRAAGEMPAAADTAGISVRRVRWMGVLTAAGMAGLGGAYLAIVDVGVFKQNMTAGRGFLALVAVIFGRWRPLGVLVACLVLGGADALQLRLADLPQVPRVVWAALIVIAVAFALFQVLRRRAHPRRLGLTVMTLLGAAGIVLLEVEPHVVLPVQLWLSLPFVIALVVLAGALTRAHMPSRLTLPYRRGEG
jgi:simple sugar transport system permease protein